jgi:hypothetical protein
MGSEIKLKRKSYAMDVRTGQVVRIEEQGGANYMVRTAYKSDGYWCERSDLTPVGNPHLWSGGQLFLFLVVLAFCAWTSYSAFDTFTSQGMSNGYAFCYAVPPGILAWIFLAYWTRLVRI